MKAIAILSLSAAIIFMASCVKPKEPRARICPEEPVVITTNDTLQLENCSENYDTQRWDLPNGAFSTQNKIAFASATVGEFIITLKVKNNDYANDYIAERKIKVVTP